ncbi:hypothetical protein BDZ91DRAFT_432263 [Kalaharituber pfeilii]|nr:hypothetical protein BDZ91DRAFT_432263 [Kalaharituber pfeilii]
MYNTLECLSERASLVFVGIDNSREKVSTFSRSADYRGRCMGCNWMLSNPLTLPHHTHQGSTATIGLSSVDVVPTQPWPDFEYIHIRQPLDLQESVNHGTSIQLLESQEPFTVRAANQTPQPDQLDSYDINPSFSFPNFQPS